MKANSSIRMQTESVLIINENTTQRETVDSSTHVQYFASQPLSLWNTIDSTFSLLKIDRYFSIYISTLRFVKVLK
jgi:hypothetical protein